jgi:DNA-binding CsgD family transcriptional regulator
VAALVLLQPRQRECLTLVALGMRNADVAGFLGISEGTVKTHLKRTYALLGVRSRTEAAVVLWREGAG